MSILQTQSKSRLVGANAPGIIAPVGSCRIGFQPLSTFAPGHIGIVAKSGTLSYEAVASLTRSGLGQSLCIGMGGDMVAGTNMVDALKVFEADAETEGIIVIGEIGGRAEEDAAEWIAEYGRRAAQPKPIAALVAGLNAPPGRVMGHAGAWAGKGERTAAEKYRVLQAVGVTMVDHPEDFGGVMKALLSQRRGTPHTIDHTMDRRQQQQRRGLHTLARRPRSRPRRPRITPAPLRHLVLHPSLASGPLGPYLAPLTETSLTEDEAPPTAVELGITVDRTARQPCILSSPAAEAQRSDRAIRRFPYDQRSPPPETLILAAVAHLGAPPNAHGNLARLIRALATMFHEKEAVTLSGSVSATPHGHLRLHQPSLTLHFDDAAFLSGNRHPDLHTLHQPPTPDKSSDELAAAGAGIVLVRLADPAATIGTLVNGAGLAMNTVDALRRHGGRAANFLDTGGKATAATVQRALQLVVRDPRVRVVLVNVFGGLTDGGVMADGILLAMRETEMRGVPVVVRIRGTREAEGQRKIAESGLGIAVFDGFAEAAERAVELAADSGPRRHLQERGGSGV